MITYVSSFRLECFYFSFFGFCLKVLFCFHSTRDGSFSWSLQIYLIFFSLFFIMANSFLSVKNSNKLLSLYKETTAWFKWTKEMLFLVRSYVSLFHLPFECGKSTKTKIFYCCELSEAFVLFFTLEWGNREFHYFRRRQINKKKEEIKQKVVKKHARTYTFDR